MGNIGSMGHTAINARLYQSPDVSVLFNKTAGCARLVYNLGLEQRSVFSRRGRNIGYVKQCADLPGFKRDQDFLWLKEVPAHCLQQALKDLDDAFARFFSGQNRYPQYRKKFENDSFRFVDPKEFEIDDSKCKKVNKTTGERRGRGFRVKLPKAGWVDAALCQPLPKDGKLTSITVKRDGDWWFAVMLFEIPDVAVERRPGEVGIDLGVAQPVVTSNGVIIDLPHVTTREMERERRLKRTIARRKKGSANHRKAKLALRRFKAAQKRRRKNALHIVTTFLSKSHGLVVIEDLKIKNMTASAKGTVEKPGKNVSQKAGLNRSMLDLAFGLFRTLLEYKMKREGGLLIAVNPRNTSRTCPHCKHVSKGNRPTRDLFCCEQCGHIADADVNAAINILALGLEQLATMVASNDNISSEGHSESAAHGDLCVGMSTEVGTGRRKQAKKVA